MIQLQVENTAQCNAKCIFCPHPVMERTKGRMNFDLWQKIVDEAAELSLISLLTITGLGEPLLDKDLKQKLKYARSKMPAIPISLFTNGSYLRKHLPLLKKYNVTTYVSLNAANSYKREQIMELDDYDEVVSAAKQGIKDGVEIIVKAVCEKDLMEGEETDKFIEEWNGRHAEGGNAFLHMEGNWAGQTGKCRIPQVTPCHRALTQIMVLWDGRVSLCCFDGEGKVILGDLNTQTIKEVFNGPKATEYRKAHIEGRRNELELCRGCTAI